MATLSKDYYGKGQVRVVKVIRDTKPHQLRDLTVDIKLEGDFTAAHLEGDNRKVLPTDSMKNTVYGLAAIHPLDTADSFAAALCKHFVETNPQAITASVEVVQRLWSQNDDESFTRGGDAEKRVAWHTASRTSSTRGGGLKDLWLLRTGGSAFCDFHRERFTTLPDAPDRVLCTRMTARWDYVDGADVDFDAVHANARATLIEVLSSHDSKSVQHTLYAMAEAVIERNEAISAVELNLPNKHNLHVDMAAFNIDSVNEVFLAINDPFGEIWARVTRD